MRTQKRSILPVPRVRETACHLAYCRFVVICVTQRSTYRNFRNSEVVKNEGVCSLSHTFYHVCFLHPKELRKAGLSRYPSNNVCVLMYVTGECRYAPVRLWTCTYIPHPFDLRKYQQQLWYFYKAAPAQGLS